jgi:hypothetical protein
VPKTRLAGEAAGIVFLAKNRVQLLDMGCRIDIFQNYGPVSESRPSNSLYPGVDSPFTRGLVMSHGAVLEEIDFIEELRLRRWARENFVPAELRQETWHPVILEEMVRKERESHLTDAALVLATSA